MGRTVRILFLGDVVGQPGVRAVFTHLRTLIKKFRADFTLLNGENASRGFGLTPEIAETFRTAGVDCITSGNHIWQDDSVFPLLQKGDFVLRPANYPLNDFGSGFTVLEKAGVKLGVLNVMGRYQLAHIDCPFRRAVKWARETKAQTPLLFVDFHAELPEEKEALAYYLEGKVTALIGTHTHVQTADERIIGGFTAYMTDAGMVGAVPSVIGGDPQTSVDRQLTMMPVKMEPAEGSCVIQGVLTEADAETGRALSVGRFSEPVF